MGSSSRPGPQRSRLDFSQPRGFVVGATRRVMPYAEPDVQEGVNDTQPLSRLSRIRSKSDRMHFCCRRRAFESVGRCAQRGTGKGLSAVP